MAIVLEQLADVHGLAAPEVPVDAPVERQLQGAPVQAAAGALAVREGRAVVLRARARRTGLGFS